MKLKGLSYDKDTQTLICKGEWSLASLPSLKASFKAISLPKKGKISINGADITKMDSAGAWLIISIQSKLKALKLTSSLDNFSDEYQRLIELVAKSLQEEQEIKERPSLSHVALIGKRAVAQFNELIEYLSFIGMLTYEVLRLLAQPMRFRFKSVAHVIYITGYKALPIILLLSMMIGVVITYQMGLQLKNYGANIYIVDLLGLAVLREFAPLLTAIMIAGRTGSAFTAQLGMMKLNEEIDALDTMGVTPAELLILPRILGLFIALPLLTVWADIFGVVGGMIMAQSQLDVSWRDFLTRFPQVIPLKTLFIGLGKAPVFALLIASIGCFEGMKVEGGADSVGRNTTRSVVLSIFFIIVADAAFSVIFSELKL